MAKSVRMPLVLTTLCAFLWLTLVTACGEPEQAQESRSEESRTEGVREENRSNTSVARDATRDVSPSILVEREDTATTFPLGTTDAKGVPLETPQQEAASTLMPQSSNIVRLPPDTSPDVATSSATQKPTVEPVTPAQGTVSTPTPQSAENPQPSPAPGQEASNPSGTPGMTFRPTQGQFPPNVTPHWPTGSFTSISAGDDYTCAVKADGLVQCWGNNAFGKASPPSGPFVSVSAGKGNSCWNLAKGTTLSSTCAGSIHSCGVRTDGTVACWGDNRLSQSSPPARGLSVGERWSCPHLWSENRRFSRMLGAQWLRGS